MTARTRAPKAQQAADSDRVDAIAMAEGPADELDKMERS